MAIEPKPGLVIRYDFLWKEEENRGITDGRKDRPCLVLAVQLGENGNKKNVVVCPITHTMPKENEKAVEIPQKMAKHLTLDSDQMWIKTHQVNKFTWDKDITPLGVTPAHKDQPVFGQMPSQLTTQARHQVNEKIRSRSLGIVKREEDSYAREMLDQYRAGRSLTSSEKDNSNGNDGNGR